jgi:hypothetical protein
MPIQQWVKMDFLYGQNDAKKSLDCREIGSVSAYSKGILVFEAGCDCRMQLGIESNQIQQIVQRHLACALFPILNGRRTTL